MARTLTMRIISKNEIDGQVDARLFNDVLSGMLDFLEAGNNAASSSRSYRNALFSIKTTAKIERGSTLIEFLLDSASQELTIELLKFLFNMGTTYLKRIRGQRHNVSNTTVAIGSKNRVDEQIAVQPMEARILRQAKLERGLHKICIKVSSANIEAVELEIDQNAKGKIRIRIDKPIAGDFCKQVAERKSRRKTPKAPRKKTRSEAYITKANFDESQKWRFRLEGTSSFYAHIDDRGFWQRVHNQDESFYENQRCVITYYTDEKGNHRITKIDLDAAGFDW